jgi:hypothetical protein
MVSGQGEFVSDIPAGDGKTAHLFFTVYSSKLGLTGLKASPIALDTMFVTRGFNARNGTIK